MRRSSFLVITLRSRRQRERCVNNGLLALGGDLSPARLLMAYQRGIFPWFSRRPYFMVVS